MPSISSHFYKISFERLFHEQNFVSFCIITIIFLTLLHFGQPTDITLDPSWTTGLGYAFEHNFQAGVDYVFTFAPLGYYQHYLSSYLPNLFDLFMIWQVLTAFIIALLIFISLRWITNPTDKFLYLVLFLVVASNWHIEPSYFIALNILFIFAIHLLEKPTITWKAAIELSTISLLIILISLGKFAFFVWMGAAIVGLTIITTWLHGWRAASILLFIHGLLFIIVWSLLGQNVANIPAFVINTLEITRGYSEAMSIQYFPTQLLYAAISFGCFILLMGLSLFTLPFKLSRVITFVMILLTLFLVWKGAFVRQGLHILIFFPTAFIIVFLIGYETTTHQIILFIQRVLRYIIVGFGLYATLVIPGILGIPYTASDLLGGWNRRIVGNTLNLLNLSRVEQGYAAHWEKLKQQHDLPKIRAVIGQSPVDIFSWGQTIIFLNGFNWHPRPVFQSYTVYTKKLMKINEQFFLTRPPEFVIVKLQAIDFQLPLSNDADSYKILLRDYEPVLEEKGFLLLKHRMQKPDNPPASILLQQPIKEGEWLEVKHLNQQPFLLTLEMKKSWLGKAYVALYRLPEVYLETRIADDKILKHRLIPQMAETGFLYNPLILTQADLNSWYAHRPLPPVQALRLVIQPAWIQRLFMPTFDVTLTEFKK